MTCVDIVVPLRTVSGANAREPWQARSRRVKKERTAVHWCLVGKTKPAIPCSVLLTRVGPTNGLDDDNLRSALKGVRDQIAQWLGVDDRHSRQVHYCYAQRRGSTWSVEIYFGPPASGAQLEILGVRALQPEEVPF